MATPAGECARRAAGWAAGDPAVRAAIVFGSVALGLDTDESDLDLIVVTEDGAIDDLWQRRTAIAEVILDGAVAAANQPTRPGARRFQASTADGRELDLTVVDEVPVVSAGLARGFVAIYDRDGVADRLATAVASWTRPEFDAAELDASTWPWLRYLHGRLHRGELFAVRASLYEMLMYRVVPMLGSRWYSVHADLRDDDLRRVHAAAPVSADPAELARALYATACAYEWALDRWAERTGQERPRHPLSALTLARLRP